MSTLAAMTHCEPRRGGLLLLLLLLLLLGAQRRWLELGTLRVGDSSLLPAGARDTVRVAAWRGPASSACAALWPIGLRLCAPCAQATPARSARLFSPAVLR